MLSSVDLRTDNNVNIFISCTGMLVPKSTLSNKGGIMESPCTQLAAEWAEKEIAPTPSVPSVRIEKRAAAAESLAATCGGEFLLRGVFAVIFVCLSIVRGDTSG